MKFIFIRHGKTKGNLEGRYVGSTDEELCAEGIGQIREDIGIYPKADILFLSPMKRCLQTAKIIYPEFSEGLSGKKKSYVVDEFREIDFGEFEGKNYDELNGDLNYQKWIGSLGEMPFPGGEAREDFIKRCARGLLKALKICEGLVSQEKEGFDTAADTAAAAFVVHGGTIMAVMSGFFGGKYYDFMCGNGHGFVCEAAVVCGAVKDGRVVKKL